jgi:hypothetical protein
VYVCCVAKCVRVTHVMHPSHRRSSLVPPQGPAAQSKLRYFKYKVVGQFTVLTEKEWETTEK